MSDVKLLAFAGSVRRDSFNRQALAVLVRGAASAGAAVTSIDLRNYAMPIYEADWEAEHGLPPAAAALQRLVAEHDGLLLASPEYNGFITPLLKNTLDWVSRPVPGVRGQSGVTFMKGKVAGLVSASPGSYGGMRSLGLARQYLTNLGFLVVPEQVAIGGAATAFGDDGDLKDDRVRTAVLAVGVRVARVAAALAAKREAV